MIVGDIVKVKKIHLVNMLLIIELFVMVIEVIIVGKEIKIFYQMLKNNI
jgi:hypothetical protein